MCPPMNAPCSQVFYTGVEIKIFFEWASTILLLVPVSHHGTHR
jgi:hypothetical protein